MKKLSNTQNDLLLASLFDGTCLLKRTFLNERKGSKNRTRWVVRLPSGRETPHAERRRAVRHLVSLARGREHVVLRAAD